MSKQITLLPTVEELNVVMQSLVGKTVAKPAGSTLAGHASGLPFEDLIHSRLLQEYPGRVLRQFEALNKNLFDHPTANTYEDRLALMGSPAVQYLVKRGVAAMKGWSPKTPFDVKQDDTAESIIFPTTDCDLNSDRIILLDVKTQDVDKKAQAPNIMSADKIARASVLALTAKKPVPFEIVYAGVKWQRDGEKMKCVEATAISMMKITPPLYINWVAAQQIQFHPFEVDQSFPGSHEDWCVAYVENFCKSLGERIKKEEERLKFFQSALD